MSRDMKCFDCGHTFSIKVGEYDKETTCPQCGSQNVRDITDEDLG